jgi:hypothetical protein
MQFNGKKLRISRLQSDISTFWSYIYVVRATLM